MGTKFLSLSWFVQGALPPTPQYFLKPLLFSALFGTNIRPEKQNQP